MVTNKAQKPQVKPQKRETMALELSRRCDVLLCNMEDNALEPNDEERYGEEGERPATKGELLATEQNMRLAEEFFICANRLHDTTQAQTEARRRESTPDEFALFCHALRIRKTVATNAEALLAFYRKRMEQRTIATGSNYFGETVEQHLLRICRFRGRAPPGTGKDVGVVQHIERFRDVRENIPVQYHVHHNVVSEHTCNRIIALIETLVETREAYANANANDIKINCSLDDFVLCLHTKEVVPLLELRDSHGLERSRIVLRKWTAEEGRAKGIPLHKDHHTKVMQIVLNAKGVMGGKLFYRDTQDHYVQRETGTCIVHDNKVLHGVTPLFKGIRYTAYFLLGGCEAAARRLLGGCATRT